MTERKQGWYTIVQYCPDRGRKEVANVGVLLLGVTEPAVTSRIDYTLSRVRKFFPKADMSSVGFDVDMATNRVTLGLLQLLPSLLGAKDVLKREGNSIVFTKLLGVMYTDLATEVDSLFKDLVMEKTP